MKNLFAALALLVSTATPALSQAATLKCWKTNFTQATAPFMAAEIGAGNSLSNIRFLYKNAQEQNFPGTLEGKLITTSRSPYKGNVAYGATPYLAIILPTDLSEQNLAATVEKGIGFYKGENGVIIGQSTEGGEGGSHYSERLVCHSDL